MMFVIGNDVGRPVGQTEDWPRGGGIVLVMSIASLTPPSRYSTTTSLPLRSWPSLTRRRRPDTGGRDDWRSSPHQGVGPRFKRPRRVRVDDGDKGRSAERHYVCVSLADIEAPPVRPLAADDCALFLWTTFPHLRQAHEVIETGDSATARLASSGGSKRVTGNASQRLLDAGEQRAVLACRARQEATQIGRRPFDHPGAGTRAFAQAGRNLRAHRGAARRSVSRTVRTKRAPKLDMLGQRGREVC
jgi:hypothetical protein